MTDYLSDGPVKGATTRERQLDRPQSPPAAIECPEELSGHARTYWDTTAPYLIGAGLLSPPEVPQFVLLCRLYESLQYVQEGMMDGGNTVREYQDLLGKFSTLASKFLLFPADRKKQNVNYRDNAARYDSVKGFKF